ncbi:MAG: glycosyltransferase family 39 protein [Candidatus Acidiferrales bacterium]
MTLLFAVLHLSVVLLIFLIATAWGLRILQLLGFATHSNLESLLFAVGFSFAALEIVLFFLSIAGWLRFATVFVLLALMAASAGRAWRQLWSTWRALFTELHHSYLTASERLVLLAILGFLVVGALSAMAPLTGSDAMHYHFTAPLLQQGRPLAPIYWMVHSFFIGQAHLLISLGLALGSDRISLGLIYLGGVLAAGALFAVSRQLMTKRWASIAVLIFLATPLVFWQMSTSGSPDMWMAFYVALAALAAARAGASDATRWLVLAGLFAGATAGVKYTGWIIPIALVVYIMVAARSFKIAVASGLAALSAGVWPLARNLCWTGDPVFPFLTRTLTPDRVNSYALGWISADTGAGRVVRDLPHILGYPFTMVLKGAAHGFGQYFGPIILAFAPLLLFARWKNPVAKVAAAFWAAMFLSNVWTSQMGRFLLPVYALSLALVLSGVSAIAERSWRAASLACTFTVLAFLAFAGISDAVYARDFLPAVLGVQSEAAFLDRMAPDYQTVEFINRTLSPEIKGSNDGSVMVFFRHLYYIRVPFVDGSPEYSWLMDPARYNDPEKLLAHLHEMNVRWVVKSPDYPKVLATAFNELEREGRLVEIASTDVENLTGTGRVYGQRQKIRVVLLEVRE